MSLETPKSSSQIFVENKVGEYLRVIMQTPNNNVDTVQRADENWYNNYRYGVGGWARFDERIIPLSITKQSNNSEIVGKARLLYYQGFEALRKIISPLA